jgi:hypothetical protein
MSVVNRRILETIEESDFAPEIKELLKALLVIEARNAEDKKPRYSEDYDRIIKKLAERRGYQEDK